MNLAVIVHGPAEAVDLVRFISICATRQKKGFLHRGNCRQLSEYDGQNYIRLDKKYRVKKHALSSMHRSALVRPPVDKRIYMYKMDILDTK